MHVSPLGRGFSLIESRFKVGIIRELLLLLCTSGDVSEIGAGKAISVAEKIKGCVSSLTWGEAVLKTDHLTSTKNSKEWILKDVSNDRVKVWLSPRRDGADSEVSATMKLGREIATQV
jgi:hypothetical protein